MKALDELRGARPALTPERTIRALDQALDAWRAPGSALVDALAGEHTLYSPSVQRQGIVRGLSAWTAQALSELRAHELRPPCRVPPVTAVWLAGSIPTASFAALLLPLLAGSAVYAKPASGDRVSPDMFARSLVAADPEVGACLKLGDDERALTSADAVVAYGSDETIAAIRARVPAGRVFVGYGHRVSVASVGPAASLKGAALCLARDMALWDGRGCLSPGWVLVDQERAEAFASVLAAALARAEKEMPRGPLSDAEELGIRELRARCALRPGTRLLTPGDATSWTVMLEPPGSVAPPGSLRAIPVIPVRDLEAVSRFCRGLAPWLSTLGHRGWPVKDAELAALVADAGGSRVCPLGRMQLPPIDWQHDGLDPIRPLVCGPDVGAEHA